MIRFTIPFNVTGKYSLNSIGERNARNAKKKAIENATHEALLVQRLNHTRVKPPVEIRLFYDTQLDVDNCGFVTKAIIDALKTTLLGDDNKSHVVRVTQEFWSGKDIGVEVYPLDKNSAPKPSKKASISRKINK